MLHKKQQHAGSTTAGILFFTKKETPELFCSGV